MYLGIALVPTVWLDMWNYKLVVLELNINTSAYIPGPQSILVWKMMIMTKLYEIVYLLEL